MYCRTFSVIPSASKVFTETLNCFHIWAVYGNVYGSLHTNSPRLLLVYVMDFLEETKNYITTSIKFMEPHKIQ